MSLSGIKLNKSITAAIKYILGPFNAETKKERLKYITLKFNDTHTEVVIADQKKFEGFDETYEQTLVNNLPKNHVRYFIYDVPGQIAAIGQNTTPKSKVVLISWNPEEAPSKEKMILAGTVEEVKRQFGVTAGTFIEADNLGECSYEVVCQSIGLLPDPNFK